MKNFEKVPYLNQYEQIALAPFLSKKEMLRLCETYKGVRSSYDGVQSWYRYHGYTEEELNHECDDIALEAHIMLGAIQKAKNNKHKKVRQLYYNTYGYTPEDLESPYHDVRFYAEIYFADKLGFEIWDFEKNTTNTGEILQKLDEIKSLLKK